MSAIINSIIARKQGKPSHHIEATGYGDTKGHAEAAPGLRAHSIDTATYPWRVVGHPGGAWSVVGADNETVERIDFNRYVGCEPHFTPDYLDEVACEEAHELARTLKRLHPTGRV